LSINVLGICEGGVFTICYAALNPKRVKNLIVTITPVDFHADQAEGRTDHGFINLWTRSLSAEDVDRLIEANGNLPGELMSFVFSTMTPLSSLTKYNLGLMDVADDEKKLLNFLRMEKWLAGVASWRSSQAMAQGSVSAKQTSQKPVRTRRAKGGAGRDHDAGTQCLRQGGSHHSPAMFAGIG
jgi:poly(3-hydroxyalkanoate) synthetase